MNAPDPQAALAGEAPSILSKAFDLLRSFNTDNRVMTLSELSRASGLPKSTVHRLIARLIDLGAVEQHRSGYAISLDVGQMASTTPAAGMRDNALPYLAALHRWSGLSVQLAVLRHFDVVYLEILKRHDVVAPRAGVGGHLHAHCMAVGKALLSWENLDDLESFLPRPLPKLTAQSISDVDDLVIELRKVRGEGLAYEHDESQPGLSAVAAPIIIHDYAVGAVSLTAASETAINLRAENALRQTAAEIARVCREDLADRKHLFPHPI